MADQRLERLPVLAGMTLAGLDQSEESGRPAGVEAGHHPAFVGFGQLDVPRPHQFGIGDVDQPVPEDVLAEQNLAFATFESPQVDLGLGQHHPFLGELRDAPDGEINPPAPDLAHQAGDQGQVAAPQANDDVVDLAYFLAGGRKHMTVQQGGQVHVRRVAGWAPVFGRARDTSELTVAATHRA